MPRDITVTMQDGRQHTIKNAPDAVTPQEAVAEARRLFGNDVASISNAAPKPQATIAETGRIDVPGQLKSLASSFAQGILDTDAFISKVSEYAFMPPGSTEPSKAVGGPTYLAEKASEAIDIPAQSQAEQYIKSAVRGAGGAVGPGIIKAPLLTLATGAGAGTGAEVAAQITSDNPLSRLIGGLVAGQVTGSAFNAALRRLAPNTEELAREGLEGITVEDLERAAKVMENAKKNYGIELDLSQALNAPKNMTALRDLLANTRYGNETQRILREQPGKAIGLSNTELAELPGNVAPSMQQVANKTQDAATEILQRLRADRSAAVNPLYAQAESLKGTNEAITSTIDEMLKTPLNSEVRRDLMRFRARMLRKPWADERRPDEWKAETFEEMDKLFKEFTGPYAPSPLNPKNPSAQADFDRIAGELRRVLYEGTDAAKQAASKYRAITETEIDPVKRGPIGRLATPRGAQPDREAAVSTLQGIFDRGTDPKAEGASEILTLAKSFKQISPDVFNDAAKTWLSRKLADAVKINEDGGIDPTSMASIRDKLFTTPAQRQGMRDVLAGMADNADLPRGRVVGAFEGFMNVLAKTAKRPATVGGLTSQEAAKLAGKSKLADAVRFWGFTANMTAGRRIEERVLGRTLTELDKLLTTKEGVEYLQIMAQDGYVSPRAIIAGANALSSINAAGNAGEAETN